MEQCDSDSFEASPIPIRRSASSIWPACMQAIPERGRWGRADELMEEHDANRPPRICLDHGSAVSPVWQHMARRSDFDHGRGRAVPLAVRDDGVVCLRGHQIADKLAEILGEPLGSLVLTLTIICLEGVLIGIAIMTSDSGATIGRDTLFGANMIMINFAGGLALFLGGLRHREQTYNFQGTSAYLAVVITLSVLGFILPNYTEATPQGSVTNVQATGISLVTLFIYVTFLLIQIGRHKHFFEESEASGNAEG